MNYVPRLIKNIHTLPGLTEQESLVLSLIDGKTSANEIAKVTGFGLATVNKTLEKLSKMDAVEIQHRETEQAKSGGQSIKELYMSYENADLYTILGVSENANVEQIKQAYFEKTKMFHPDSYYARSVPAEDKHFLVDLYKKVQQAYETLKNKAPKKEPETAKQSSSAKFETTVIKPQQQAKQEPAHSAMTDQIRERVKKARTYYKIGMEAFMKSNYATAYLNFKLANSYNPYEKDYMDKLKETEKYMKVERHQELLKKADISIELNKPQDAIDFLKSALEMAHEKKHVYYKLALVMHDFNQSLKEAKQYCQEAIALDPKNPDYHLLLAKIYQKAGLVKSSVFEYEQTMALGGKTDDIKTEIKQLKSMLK